METKKQTHIYTQTHKMGQKKCTFCSASLIENNSPTMGTAIAKRRGT